MKKAVIYARYSSASQTEQSIEGQLRVCQDYAKHNDILIVGEYIDRAMTGTNDARPNFQRMIKDSGKQEWEIVLVYKLDRFSRNKYDNAINKRTLKNNGVRVVSATEHIPDSPEAVIFESMLEGMAQYYSEELSQKVHRGLDESYRKGNYTGGYQILGYDVMNKKNVINEAEAAIVREIFTKYANGYTAQAIAADFQKRGVRGKRNTVLTDKQIYKILGNTKYNGKVRHGETVYDNIYPKIIDDVLWQAVQDIHVENQHAPSRKKDIFDYILSGKLVCGHCKRQMVGISGTSKTGAIHYYYACLSRTRYKEQCPAKTITKQELEDLVIHTTWQMLASDETITKIATDLFELHQKESRDSSKLKGLESNRAAALKARTNLISAMEQGIITEQTKIRLKELETEIARLDYAIEEEKQRKYTYLTVEMIERYLRNVICGDIDAVDVRKLIVKHFIREVQLFNDHVLISYNFTEDHPPYSITKTYSKALDHCTQNPYNGIPLFVSSNILTPCPPSETRLNPGGSSEFSFAFFGLKYSIISVVSSVEMVVGLFVGIVEDNALASCTITQLTDESRTRYHVLRQPDSIMGLDCRIVFVQRLTKLRLRKDESQVQLSMANRTIRREVARSARAYRQCC